MHATINYWLTEAGRKASILAGGSGDERQTVRVEFGHPLFPRIVELGTVGTGEVVLDAGSPYGDRKFAAPAGPAHLVAYVEAELARAAAKRQADVEAKRQETQVVLDGRITRQTRYTYTWGGWTELAADWPYNADTDVTGSNTAQAWVADLAAANTAAEAACDALKPAWEAKQARLKAEAIARASAIASALAARCIELGGKADDLLLKVEAGALVQVPKGCWESHSRGKNWLAVISPNPSSPGGLERSFQEKAKSDYFYLISGLSVGDAVEFGADYYSGRGRKSPTRWYGFVVAKAADAIVVRNYAGGKTAYKAARKFMETYQAQPVCVND